MVQNFNASVLHGAKDIRLEKRSIDQPGPLELQVKVKATSVCNSDVKYYKDGRNGNFILTSPLALGHESAGIVTGIGANLVSTNQWKIGDKVALEVGVPCGENTCDQCVSGRYNICPQLRFRSSGKKIDGRTYDGTLQGFINHPAKWCHKLATDVDYIEAALLEPLCVAVHAVERSKLSNNATCLIFGAGAIGLLIASVCLAYGAKSVLIADVDAGRISFALERKFATEGYIVPISTASADPIERLQASETLSATLKEKAGLMTQSGFDRVFDATGIESCVQTSIYAAKSGGAILLIGMGTPNMFLPLSTAALAEKDILGVFRYAHDYPKAVGLIESGRIPNLKSLITHKFVGLENGANALEMAAKTRDQEGKLIIKVVLETGDEDFF